MNGPWLVMVGTNDWRLEGCAEFVVDRLTFEDAYRIIQDIGPYVGRCCRGLDEAALNLVAAYRLFYDGNGARRSFCRMDVIFAVKAFMWAHPNAIRLVADRELREQVYMLRDQDTADP